MVPEQQVCRDFEPGKIGTLDWETERVSPSPLRSQLKLYQPVENSVNENRDSSGVLKRKFNESYCDLGH